MSRKLTLIATIALFACALLLGTVIAQEAETEGEKQEEAKEFEYIGHKKCKICHRAEHKSWTESVHAKAWETLSEEEQKNEDCIGCHSTGVDDDGELLTGVQCEACHGPGSEYKSQKVMKDKELSLANGLIEPNKELCESCHNEKSPTFKGFDYEEAIKNTAAIHVVEEEKEEK